MKNASWPARNIRSKHRHVDPGFKVAYRQSGLEQCVLEREGTADQEAHHVITPVTYQVGGLIRQFAILVNTIARQVGAKVSARGDQSGLRITRLSHVEQRTRLRIPLTKQKKIESHLFGHNNQVGLYESHR